MALSPWIGTTAKTSSATTGPLTIDITGATVGEWCYCLVIGKRDQTSYTFSNWTQVGQAINNTGLQGMALFRRQKQSGDTTFNVSVSLSTTWCAVPFSYPGLDPATPDEIAAGTQSTTFGQVDTSAANNMPTPTFTPSAGNRWALCLFAANGSNSSNKLGTWTPTSLTDRLDDVNTTGTITWESFEIADSNGPISQTSQSYTSNFNNGTTTNNGIGAFLLLIPAMTPPFQAQARVRPAVHRAASY